MDIILEEEERTRPELLRRGFEFYRYRELPTDFLSAEAHVHDAIEFIYLIEGSAVVKLDEREARLEKGDLVMFRSRGIHSVRTGEHHTNRYYILKIRPKLLHNICPKNLSARIAFRLSVHNNDLKFVWRREELENTDIYDGLLRLMQDDNDNKEDELIDISMLSSLFKVLYGILKNTESEQETLVPESDQIYDSILFINESFADDITAEDAAARLNVSYSYFARAFKHATGKTFKEYLNIARTNEAELLLLNTDLSVTEIATKCGYNNISHFISTYKRYKGKTPLSERKHH